MLSVIVPVYNVDKYLKKCVDSILCQSYEDFELILVDDGSNDKSAEIVDSYTDKRIITKHIKNSGVSHARNIGIENAHGEILTFVDADDFLGRDHFKNLVSGFQNGADLSITNIMMSNEDLNDNSTVQANGNYYIYKKDELLVSMYDKSQFRGYVFNKAFRKEIIEKYHLRFDEQVRMCEDHLFCIEYAIHIDSAIYFTSPTYYYVQRTGSAMSKIPSAVTYGTKYIAYKKIYDIAKTQNDKFLLETKKIICKNLCSSFWHQLYYDSRRKYVSDKEAREFLNSNFELLDAKQKAMTIFERIIPSIVKIIRRIN